jgi:hypothetical protein
MNVPDIGHDHLFREFAPGPSRRGLLGGLIGGAFATLFRAGEPAEAKKRKKHKKRKKPKVRLDATCPGPGSSSVNGYSNDRYAQNFTPRRSGQLVEAGFFVSKEEGTTGDFVMQLLAVDQYGVPTSTVLASTIRPNASVPPGFGGQDWLTFAFDSPAKVTAGKSYALAIGRPGVDTFFQLRRDNSGLACGGQSYLSHVAEGGFEATQSYFPFTTSVRS